MINRMSSGIVVGLLTVILTLSSGAAPSFAEPAGDSSLSHTTGLVHVADRQWELSVYSESMDRVIMLDVLRPETGNESLPVLYLLGELWEQKTDVKDFFSDKNVNVVMPRGGAYTYYADWKNDDPVLGRNKWSTFLTRELPPIIDDVLKTNGKNSIAGISMAATSVLSLAIDAPGLYSAVGSYSGCAQTSDPLGALYVRILVEGRGGGDTANMWGPTDDPAWAANDPYLRADELRGTEIYISNGAGLPGPHDTFDSPGIDRDPKAWVDRLVVGGLIEAATNMCTSRLTSRLDTIGIDYTFNFRVNRTHDWGYWQDDLHDSWPMFEAAMRGSTS